MIFALVIFILIFSFLILSHEFGHFIIAKKSGVRVEEFGLGYPPRMFGKKIGETTYSINWIPFGGFVSLYGENPKERDEEDERNFASKSPLTKAGILSAGVIINFLTAVIIFYFLLVFSGFQTSQTQLFDYQFPFGQQTNHPIVSQVATDSPAASFGIKPYDLVISANNEEMHEVDEFISFIDENKGEEVTLVLENLHTEKKKTVEVTPRVNPPEGEGSLGVRLSKVSQLSYKSGSEKAFSGFLHSLNLGHFTLSTLGRLIKTSFVQRDVGPVSKSVAGPVGILALTKLTAAQGFWPLLKLMGMLALALSLINILPIPGADGGRLVFVLYEAIARKKAPPKLEKAVNIAGFYFLVLLLFLITFKDIFQFKDILF